MYNIHCDQHKEVSRQCGHVCNSGVLLTVFNHTVFPWALYLAKLDMLKTEVASTSALRNETK